MEHIVTVTTLRKFEESEVFCVQNLFTFVFTWNHSCMYSFYNAETSIIVENMIRVAAISKIGKKHNQFSVQEDLVL